MNNIIFKDGWADNGGAIIFNNKISDSIISNCGFLANNAYGDGGALYFKALAEVTIENTIFNFNGAVGNGGAIYFLDVSDSNTFKDTQFLNNMAETGDGGAINFYSNIINGVFDNVTFMNNFGGNGGAINMDSSTESTLFNRTSFISNTARKNGGAINVNADVENTTIANSEFKDNTADSGTNNIALNGVGTFELDNVSPENLGPTYLAILTIINVTDNVAYGGNVEIILNVTDKLHKPLNGTVSVLINGENHTANVENGCGKIMLSGLDAGKYDLDVIYSGMDYIAVSPVTFNILKQNAAISAASKAYVINYGGEYSITLKDADGKVLTGKNVIFTLNGKSIASATTNYRGIATIALTEKILKATKVGNKNLVIKFTDSNYNIALKTVKITINKEKTKLSAKNKKFKKATKIKKYTITLKNSKGKGIKKVKVTMKVKGKKYTVKTNSKGKATFKIKNLMKKGKFKSTIAFKGNAYYKKVTKKVKIIVK